VEERGLPRDALHRLKQEPAS